MKTFDKTAYTLGILFYASLFIGVVSFLVILVDSAQNDPMKEVKEAAETVLETVDLTTGLEELDLAVEQDLKDLEAQFNS